VIKNLDAVEATLDQCCSHAVVASGQEGEIMVVKKIQHLPPGNGVTAHKA
jgi:hypothetical protein